METNTIEMGPIMLYTVAWIVYIIGFTLHIRIIKLSKKVKEAMTWKLDITNSSILLTLNSIAIVMHGVTYIVPDLHTYTGRWFCYTFIAVAHYSSLYHIGHSLVVSILKYVIIVHWQKIRAFGEEKFKEMIFWLNIFHPIVGLALHFLARPDFLFVFAGVTPANRCLGEGGEDTVYNKTLRLTILGVCEIPEPVSLNWFYDALFMVRKSVCVLQTISVILIALNIFEIFIYYQIFSFAYR
jgi:hypothetical protein